MQTEVHYSAREHFWLWTVCVLGFLVVNGTFAYGLLRPGILAAAVTNPLALAFVAEAFMLMGVLAYLLPKWNVSRISWQWFVLLSLFGSIAFALPIALLRRRPKRDAGSLGA